MLRFLNRIYPILISITCIYLFVLYFIYSWGDFRTVINGVPLMWMTVILCTLYLYIFRRHHLFCFETIFFIIYIISTFFFEIILLNVSADTNIASILTTQFNYNIENKGIILQTLSIIIFILGATFENKRKYKIHRIFQIRYNLKNTNIILSIFLTSYLIMLIITGNVSTWFHYSGGSDDYSNTTVVYLTIICLVFTATEFSRLYKLNCTSLKSIIKKINKIYLFDILLISFLLIISGNRNEALLILLPPIVSYCVFIRYLSNKVFMILTVIGVFIMIFIGLTRQSGISSESVADTEISLYGSARDFGVVSINTKYLVYYVDKKEPIYFNNAIATAFSSIPFIGGLYVGITGHRGDARSTEITTLGMQSPNKNSGLGTSLVGDLYYTGGFVFVIFFMFFFGVFQAYLYKRFVISRDYNIWLLIIYLYLFANGVYYVRAEWTMPLRYIGFSFVLLGVLLFCCRRKTIISSKTI